MQDLLDSHEIAPVPTSQVTDFGKDDISLIPVWPKEQINIQNHPTTLVVPTTPVSEKAILPPNTPKQPPPPPTPASTIAGLTSARKRRRGTGYNTGIGKTVPQSSSSLNIEPIHSPFFEVKGTKATTRSATRSTTIAQKEKEKEKDRDMLDFGDDDEDVSTLPPPAKRMMRRPSAVPGLSSRTRKPAVKR